MYILQCGDYHHLIDWIDEDMTPPPPVIQEEHVQNVKKGHGIMNFNTSRKSDGFNQPHNTNNCYPKSTAFIIYDTTAFETHVLPAIFKQGKFDSFERKLYRWGFAKQKATGAGRSTDFSSKTSSSCSIYEHPYFCKGDYATASRIACSGSEVKRYKQIHKDKEKDLRTLRRTGTGSVSSTRKTSSSANSQDMATSLSSAYARLTNENGILQRPREVPGSRVTNDEEDEYGSDAFMGSTTTTTTTRTFNNNTSTIQHIDEQEEDDENGEMAEQKEHLGITRLFSSSIERNDITTSGVLVEAGEVGESILNDILLADRDIILLEQLRTRYDDRQKDIEMMLVPFSF